MMVLGSPNLGSTGQLLPSHQPWSPTKAESGSSKRKLYLCSKSSCFFRNSSPSSEESSTTSWTEVPGTLRDKMEWGWGQPSSGMLAILTHPILPRTLQ